MRMYLGVQGGIICALTTGVYIYCKCVCVCVCTSKNKRKSRAIERGMSGWVSCWGGRFVCISAPMRACKKWKCVCVCNRESVCVCACMHVCVVYVFAHSLGRYPAISISSNPDSASIMTPLVTNPYWWECTHTYKHAHKYPSCRLDTSSH